MKTKISIRKILFWVLFLNSILINAQVNNPLVEAHKLLSEGHYDKALQKFKDIFFNTYSPYPALFIGDMYADGLGTKPDHKAAFEFYKSVADIEVSADDDMELKIMVAYACRCAGMIYEDEDEEKGDKVSFDYFMKAHKLTGDALSEFFIGNCYEDGIVVEANLEKAIEFYEMAHKKKCICATERLACLYRESNPDQALSLDTEAANTTLIHKNIDDIFSLWTTPNMALNPLVMESWNTAVYNVAHFLQEQGESGHALEYLDKLTILTPQRLALKAYCHALQDNKELALSEFAESLKMEETGYAYNMMAVLYEHKWDDSEKAELYYKKAISLGHKLAEDNYKRLLENKK